MIEEIGEQLLYSTKHRPALPISAETTTGVRTFAIAEKNARFPSRQEKLGEIFIKDQKGTALSSPEGLNEGIQELKEKTGLLVADSLTSVSQGKSCLNVLNMRNEAINIYHDSNTAHYTNLRHQIQVNGFFRARNDRSIRSPLN